MRTSDMLPEECRKEIQDFRDHLDWEISQLSSSGDRLKNASAVVILDWVLGKEEKV